MQKTHKSISHNFRGGVKSFSCIAAMAVALIAPRASYAQDCTGPDGYTGTILYNASFDVFQGCTLNGWVAFHAVKSPPPPFAFSFTDVADVSSFTLIQSNIVQISGLGAAVPLNITGKGTPQFRNCSDASCATEITTWGNSPLSVSDGEYLQLRLTSSESSQQTNNAIITDGTHQEIWSVATEYVNNCSAASPPEGTLCADGTVYAGITPDGNVKMYVTRCDAGMTWDGSSCSGTRLALPWNDGNTNYVTTGYVSAATGQANTAGLAVTDANDVAAGTQDHIAAVYCDDLVQGGHSDWYLPARTELDVIYGNKTVIGNFSTGYYWSSSENFTSSAWRQSFSDGSQNSNSEYNNNAVRCARR